jgi:hypothetical protein
LSFLQIRASRASFYESVGKLDLAGTRIAYDSPTPGKSFWKRIILIATTRPRRPVYMFETLSGNLVEVVEIRLMSSSSQGNSDSVWDK